MKDSILEYALSKLQEMSLVTGINDFSVRFLRRGPSYGRTIRSRGRDLPLGSMVVLANRIESSSHALLESGVACKIGTEMKMLADEINQHIYLKALLQN